MNIQLSTLNRILIIGGLFLIIALLGFFFVFQPKKQQEGVTRAEIADLQAQYDALKRVADQKPLYLALTGQIRSRLKGVEVTADPRTYIPSYLKQIESLATQDGLLVTAVTPQATAAPSPGPSAAPGTNVHPPNLPGPVAGAAGQVAGALGGRSAQSAQAVNQAPGGAAPAPAGGAPSPGAPGAQGAAAPGGESGTPRAAALAYLNSSFTQVPIGMTLDGHYVQFVKFLRDLVKFQKLIGVGDVTLNGTTEAAAGSRVKINIPITAYRLTPNVSPTGPLVLPTPTPKPKPGAKK